MRAAALRAVVVASAFVVATPALAATLPQAASTASPTTAPAPSARAASSVDTVTGAPVVVVPSAAASASGSGPRSAAAAELKPHTVTYRVTFKGMDAGDLELRLTREGDGRWRYETRPQPSLLARMFVSAQTYERGVFTVGPDGVQPLSYVLDDGTSKSTNDEVSLEFDRAAGRVRGRARGEPLDLEIVPGLQDPMSIRAAILVDLLAGRPLGEYPMLDGRHVRTYVYRRAGTAKLRTALGEIETVVYTSARKGADARARTWKYWYAPSLGWLPVRIEQLDGGETRIAFAIRSAKFD
jgi:hypothetical protein